MCSPECSSGWREVTQFDSLPITESETSDRCGVANRHSRVYQRRSRAVGSRHNHADLARTALSGGRSLPPSSFRATLNIGHLLSKVSALTMADTICVRHRAMKWFQQFNSLSLIVTCDTVEVIWCLRACVCEQNKLCGRPPQYALAPCKLTFDLLTLKVMYESRVTWATSVPILVFLCLSVLDLGPMYATDVRQTDRQTSDAHHRLMPR